MKSQAAGLMKTPVAVPPETLVTEVARLMKKSNIGSVLVGDPKRPAGIFTERDVCRRVIAEGLDPAKTPVGEVMSKKLVTVDASEPLDKIFDCLAKGQFRHVPITEGKEVVGIVSLTDLAYVFREMYKDEKFLENFTD